MVGLSLDDGLLWILSWMIIISDVFDDDDDDDDDDDVDDVSGFPAPQDNSGVEPDGQFWKANVVGRLGLVWNISLALKSHLVTSTTVPFIPVDVLCLIAT